MASNPDARGFVFFHHPDPMQELTPSPMPNVSQEPLINRELTFRNSTFGALKTYMRDHKRRTGETLSNAAAVDMILRAHLARHIHPDAVKTMHGLSRPQAMVALQELPSEPDEEAVRKVPAAPCAPRIINLSMSHRSRPFVRPSEGEMGDST